MKKIAADIVGFFGIIFGGLGRLFKATMALIWYPFGVVVAFLAKALVEVAKGVRAVAKAIWSGILATVKAAVQFCKTKPMATIALFAIGWFVVIVVCATLYVWDASFYSRQAAPTLPVLSYMAVGVAFRTVAIVGLPFIIRSIRRREWGGALSWSAVWLISIPACALAAMGAVTEGQDYHYRNANAIVGAKDVSVDSFDAQIARIEAEKATERAETEKLIAGARASMREVTTDGDSSNDDLTAFESNIRNYTADGKLKQDQLDEQIAALEAAKLSAQTTATADAVTEPPIAAVYQFPARYVPQVEPIWVRDGAAVYWVFGLEIIGFLLPGTLYAGHLVVGNRAAVPKQNKARRPKKLLRLQTKAPFFRWEDAPLPPTPEEMAREELEQQERMLKAAISNADAIKRINALRDQLSAITNPQPANTSTSPPVRTLSPEQRDNMQDAKDLLNKTRDQQNKIPAGDWRNRADRLPKVA